MKTITIDIRPLADTLGDFTQTWKSGKTTAPRISFESPELLFKVLSGKRWELLNTMPARVPCLSAKRRGAWSAMSNPCTAT